MFSSFEGFLAGSPYPFPLPAFSSCMWLRQSMGKHWEVRGWWYIGSMICFCFLHSMQLVKGLCLLAGPRGLREVSWAELNHHPSSCWRLNSYILLTWFYFFPSGVSGGWVRAITLKCLKWLNHPLIFVAAFLGSLGAIGLFSTIWLQLVLLPETSV